MTKKTDLDRQQMMLEKLLCSQDGAREITKDLLRDELSQRKVCNLCWIN